MKIRMRHFTTLDKVARDGDIDRNAITMDSRHHLLALIDTLHEKYSFQDAEYKEVVEALAVNKKLPPLDIENATHVLIKYDREDQIKHGPKLAGVATGRTCIYIYIYIIIYDTIRVSLRTVTQS